MRMRKRSNLIPRMERCGEIQIKEPAAYCGRWKELFPEAAELRVEIGCGKGRFTIETAAANPQVLFVAIEKVPDALIIAMESAVNRGLKNVFFIACDAVELPDIFAPGEVDRLYLNFSDPWPRKKNAKRRLTYHTFLERYAWVLSDTGYLEFKTDNRPLFDFSEEELLAYGWSVADVTRDRHANGPVGVMTDYEEKFWQEGKPICYLRATPANRPDTKPVRLDRFPERDADADEDSEE